MDKGNAIIIILLILIVLSAGVYAIVTGTGLSFNHDDKINQTNYTVNKTNATVNNTNTTSQSTTRDTGIYAPDASQSSSSDSGNSYSSANLKYNQQIVDNMNLHLTVLDKVKPQAILIKN